MAERVQTRAIQPESIGKKAEVMLEGWAIAAGKVFGTQSANGRRRYITKDIIKRIGNKVETTNVIYILKGKINGQGR